jgi:hypothetical protein
MTLSGKRLIPTRFLRVFQLAGGGNDHYTLRAERILHVKPN